MLHEHQGREVGELRVPEMQDPQFDSISVGAKNLAKLLHAEMIDWYTTDVQLH